MGLQLITACLVTCLLLYLPGFVCLYRRGGLIRSLFFAPIVSIALYAILGIALGALRVFTTAEMLVIFAFAISLCIGTVRNIIRSNQVGSKGDGTLSLATLKIALIACAFTGIALYMIFYSRFAFGKEVIQGFDTVYHVNLVRSFIQSGNYSVLNSSTYIDSVAPIGIGAAFYPAGWHILVALTSELVSLSIAGAVNIVNLCIAGVVFPANVVAFLSLVFIEDRHLVRYGVIAVCVFLAFPWLLLLKGEQLPQLASFVMVSASAAVFISAEQSAGGSTKACISNLVLFAVSLFALLVLQTNAVFTVGIICLFYMLKRINEGSLFSFSINRHRKVACFGVFLAALVIWFFISRLGFMRGIVEYNWPSSATAIQAFVNFFTLAFNEGTFAQVILGLIVFLGFARSVLSRRYRWLGALTVFFGVIYVVAVSSEGPVKHFLAGFWYTDPLRLGAMAVIAFLPLACLGFDTLFRVGAAAMRAFLISDTFDQRRRLPEWFSVGLYSVACIALCLFPNYSIQGHGDVTTPFGYFRAEIWRLSRETYPNILDSAEAEQISAINDLVEGSLVINIPDDGSSFCYGLFGMNMYYHRNYCDDKSETEVSKIIRKQLDEYASNEDVRQAVRTIGAKYVLQLDNGDAEISTTFHTFKWEDWDGILEINENTPGFKLIYESGDVRLFEIMDI